MTQDEFQALFQAVSDGDPAAACALGDFLVDRALDNDGAEEVLAATTMHVQDGVQNYVSIYCRISRHQITAAVFDYCSCSLYHWVTPDPGNDDFPDRVAREIPKRIQWAKEQLARSLRVDRDDS